MSINLSGSVGNGGMNNSDDVMAIQERLLELGFDMVGIADGIVGPKTIRAIQLFQSIKNGAQTLSGDGRVDVNGDTHRWLNAPNAPQWQKMTVQGDGFVNIEVRDQLRDDHDYGTSWLDSTLRAAALQYQTDYREPHDSSLVTVNDTSKPEGGDTPDHSGHETGLSCDLRLPQKNDSGASSGGRTWRSADYDRAATRMILIALRSQPLCNTASLFFNDEVLIAEGKCKPLRGHDDHIHFQIKPPTRDN